MGGQRLRDGCWMEASEADQMRASPRTINSRGYRAWMTGWKGGGQGDQVGEGGWEVRGRVTGDGKEWVPMMTMMQMMMMIDN